tara:strand:+ start:122138 stop:122596 length:459 start_codon:yes stop_codon:yes gene_type:complete
MLEHNERSEVILEKFSKEFAANNSDFIGKIADHHVIIDVSLKEAHFWSPQLNLEIEKKDNNGTLIKGLFGPKPQVWTFFMFIHFAVALAFIIFLVLAYVKWTLDQAYTFSVLMCLVMFVCWFVLYTLGQLGKKKGYEQMLLLDQFMKKVLAK